MPVYEGTHSELVSATPEKTFATMTDFERLPDWQGPLERCQVLTRNSDGLAEDVEYEIDAKVRRVTYRLRHSYRPPHEIGSEYLGGDFDCFEGRWTFAAAGEGSTEARFDLRIDPGLPIPGRLQRLLNDRVLKSAVRDLRRRLEEG